MAWWQAAGWELAGGMAAGLMSLMMAIATAGFARPWRGHPGLVGPRLLVFASGLALGALAAAAMHASMSGAWPAFVIGVGAPAAMRGLLSGVEVSERDSPPTARQGTRSGRAGGDRPC
ncbi:hypothetical protein [Actinomadura craniellae]|uniref:hypothetical protein n=1 Tax=Actinomadura craniellae TaxID=2231787 RepID=UPI001F3DCBDB|nr:hypothetical protein [Actinomadura craniellae]